MSHRTLLSHSLLLLALGASAVAARSPQADASGSSPYGNSLGQAFIDDAITARVKVRLSARATLNNSSIRVTTLNGVVTLEGSASDSAARLAAFKDAGSVEAVRRVDNKLVLRPAVKTASQPRSTH